MTNPDERYYRADSVPVSLIKELKEAAERRGISVKEAINLLMLPRVGLGPWDFQLRAEILRGQKAVAEGEFLNAECEDLGTHLPAATKERLTEAAVQLGVQIGAAGRLILIGRAGTIERCLPLPKRPKPRAEAEDQEAVGF